VPRQPKNSGAATAKTQLSEGQGVVTTFLNRELPIPCQLAPVLINHAPSENGVVIVSIGLLTALTHVYDVLRILHSVAH